MFAIKPTSVKAPIGVQRAVVAHSKADRRAVLGSLIAGVSSLAAGKALAEATPVDLFDDRSVKKKGFEIIYEARDLDLSQNERDGIQQYRGDLTATKSRYQEASKRLANDLGGYIDKQYWTLAKEELRNQVGNFRQDLKTLAQSKGTKEERKASLAKAKGLVTACEDLDYAIRSKDLGKAQKLYATVKDKLNDFTTTVA